MGKSTVIVVGSFNNKIRCPFLSLSEWEDNQMQTDFIITKCFNLYHFRIRWRAMLNHHSRSNRWFNKADATDYTFCVSRLAGRIWMLGGVYKILRMWKGTIFTISNSTLLLSKVLIICGRQWSCQKTVARLEKFAIQNIEEWSLFLWGPISKEQCN
jgi:hypothetical protein